MKKFGTKENVSLESKIQKRKEKFGLNVYFLFLVIRIKY